MNETNHLDDLGKINLASECYVIKDGKVLMFKRADNSTRFPGFWIGPGGHIDQDEDAMLAVIREIEEEAGIKVDTDDVKLKAIALHHHLDLEEIWVSFVFLATIKANQVEKKEDEEGNAKWIPLGELLKMDNVFPPSKFYFEHVLNDKAGILYTNIEWNKSQLVRVLNQRVDKNG